MVRGVYEAFADAEYRPSRRGSSGSSPGGGRSISGRRRDGCGSAGRHNGPDRVTLGRVRRLMTPGWPPPDHRRGRVRQVSVVAWTWPRAARRGSPFFNLTGQPAITVPAGFGHRRPPAQHPTRRQARLRRAALLAGRPDRSSAPLGPGAAGYGFSDLAERDSRRLAPGGTGGAGCLLDQVAATEGHD